MHGLEIVREARIIPCVALLEPYQFGPGEPLFWNTGLKHGNYLAIALNLERSAAPLYAVQDLREVLGQIGLA